MTVKQDSLIGHSIGNYTVLSKLGSGAMGEVYLGEHPQIGRKVAIKVLVASLSSDSQMAERFMAEARAVNAINHPNVIQIFDFGQLPSGRLYYTMEFLEGQELTGVIKKRAPLSLGETQELLRQMAASLDAAHAAGIVHRDLKPDNVFVMEERTGWIVKILDFGIAKLLEPGLGSQTKTSTGMIMGTPMYMSPEQAAGEVKRISPRTDIYALAVIVYQMLSGRLPLQAPSVAQLLAMQITEPPRPLHEVTEGLPRAVCEVVQKSLAKDPDLRHQRAGEFYRDFVEACSGAELGMAATALGRPDQVGRVDSGPFMQSGPAAVAPAGGLPPTTLGNAAAQVAVGAQSIPPAASKARLIGVVAVTAVVILGVGAGVYLAARRSGKGPKTTASEKPAMALTRPRPVQADAEAPMPARSQPDPRLNLKIYKVQVGSGTKKVRVEVNVAGQASFTRKPPFRIDVKEGERVTLKATRPGFEEEVLSWVATKHRKVVFKLRRSSQRGRKPGPMAEPPRPRPVVAPPPRPAPPMTGPRRAGEGTLKPMF